MEQLFTSTTIHGGGGRRRLLGLAEKMLGALGVWVEEESPVTLMLFCLGDALLRKVLEDVTTARVPVR